MKKILLAVSIISFAASAFSYKILDESINATPGFNFRVETLHPKNNNVLSAAASASAPDRVGVVNQLIQIDGYHDLSVTNETTAVKVYEYSYTIECGTSYGGYIRHIQLNPGETFAAYDHTYGTVQSEKPAILTIMAVTRVTGQSSASGVGYGTLTIK